MDLFLILGVDEAMQISGAPNENSGQKPKIQDAPGRKL